MMNDLMQGSKINTQVNYTGLRKSNIKNQNRYSTLSMIKQSLLANVEGFVTEDSRSASVVPLQALRLV